ncbi:MAG: hypothetical protein ABIO02_02865, partial [Patescibacteria group bacterium]
GRRGDQTKLWSLGVKPQLEAVRHLWKGLRWHAANMLDWNKPGVVMPEQLDNLPLNPATK